MRILVIGSGFIGGPLAKELQERGFNVRPTTRAELDLLDPIKVSTDPQIIYLCASMHTFRECEVDPLAYRTNVDGPIKVALMYPAAKIIYLSSEAVELCLGTNYGRHMALAEIGLFAVTKPVIARLGGGKLTEARLPSCVNFLIDLLKKPMGYYYWS